MKIVLDCNVVISAGITNDGVCRRVFFKVIKDHFCCVSQEILDEYRDTAAKPKFGKFRWKILEYIGILEECSEFANPSHAKIELPDPDDLMYLNLAYHVKADAIITGNKKHFPMVKYEKIKIISPREFLEL